MTDRSSSLHAPGDRARRPGAAALQWGGGLLLALVAAALLALPIALGHRALPEGGRAAAPRYAEDRLELALRGPSWLVGDEAGDGAGFDAASASGPDPLRLAGSDRLGRDVLLRSLLGLGVSLLVGTSAAVVATGFGTLVGLVAGAGSPRLDRLLMRATDLFYAIPSILLVVLLAMAVDGATQRAGLEPGPGGRRAIELATLLAAIGLVAWPPTARVVRSEVRSLRTRPFMEATIALGLPVHRRLFVHLLPNLAGPIVVQATLAVPSAVLVEAFLGFLGIGVRPPLPSLGVLVADGLAEVNPVESRWWLLAVPGGLTSLLLLALLLVGDGLRARVARR